MFLKNVTNSFQSFTIDRKPYVIDPGQTFQVSDDQMKDPNIKILLASKKLEKVGEKKGTSAVINAAKKKEEADNAAKIGLTKTNSNDNKTDVATVVQCSAYTANGARCTSKISVPSDEFDSEKPYFCGRHKNENPEDYVNENGIFVKKSTSGDDEDIDQKPEEKTVDPVDDVNDGQDDAEDDDKNENPEDAKSEDKAEEKPVKDEKQTKGAKNNDK